jgi:hypothetical protein
MRGRLELFETVYAATARLRAQVRWRQEMKGAARGPGGIDALSLVGWPCLCRWRVEMPELSRYYSGPSFVIRFTLQRLTTHAQQIKQAPSVT